MTIHFPIVFMFAVPLFTLFTGNRAFELTVFHCLGVGIFFTPVAIGTGYYTWWLNYLAKPIRTIRISRSMA